MCALVQVGLHFCCSQTPEDRFSHVEAHMIINYNLPQFLSNPVISMHLQQHMNSIFKDHMNSIFKDHMNSISKGHGFIFS